MESVAVQAVILTEKGKAELERNLKDAGEMLSDIAGQLKNLANSGVVLKLSALQAKELSSQFEALADEVSHWISNKHVQQNIGER